ncbi:MAG: hypothetical protein JW840_03005 [Candidatus Thermoplasmatota archaeon]|nr:hypothetical protein [Candidatus Thermoplasmatota archaeon]
MIQGKIRIYIHRILSMIMIFNDEIKNLNLKWITFNEVKKDGKKVPKTRGVYLFKYHKKIETITGEKTDIIYIGQSSDLRHRIVHNYLDGRGGKTTKRIHRNLIDRKYLKKIKVSWDEMPHSKKRETELLESFEEKYHQLPCWNRSG